MSNSEQKPVDAALPPNGPSRNFFEAHFNFIVFIVAMLSCARTIAVLPQLVSVGALPILAFLPFQLAFLALGAAALILDQGAGKARNLCLLLAAMALFLLVILAGCALQALVLPHNILLHDFSRTVPPLLFALLLSALLPLLMIAFSKNPVRPLLLLGAIAALTAGLAMPTSGMLDPLKTPAMLLIVCAALFAFRAARKPAAT